jgi:diguanylate cyclase (GGDEF)-like protein
MTSPQPPQPQMTTTDPTIEDAHPTASCTGDDAGLLARLAWWLYLLAVALLTSAYLLAHYLGPSWLNSGPVYNLIGASTVAVLLVGARRCAPQRRLPWQLFALGQGLFVVGDILAYNYQRLFGGALPSPSIADPFHLAFYPLLIAGLLLLLRERNYARDRAALIDALITTVALASLAWVYLMAPYADDPTLSLPTKLVSIAYPTMDILILAVVARAAASSHRREPALTLLFFGTVALLLTDALQGWQLLHGGYHTGGLLDAGWASFYALLGAAALHPSVRLEPEGAPEPDGRLTRARLALLTCASLTALLIIVVREAAGDSLDIDVLIAASGIMFALVIARMAGIVRRNEEVTSREAALRAELFQAELEHRAFHDELTGLPNRALFRNRVEHALARRRRERLPVAVLFLDVDDFKNVNDSLGHAAGDEVLQEVARRLQDCMRPVDTTARLGGDEFAILVHDAESELHSIEIAQRARSALEVPIALEGREITIAASIGIAFSDQGMISAQDAEELLRNADAAMYMAKESGKGDYRVFQPEMHAKALARLELKTDLQRALDAGEFTLRYQPIMDLLRGDIGGMEALIRWEHPVRGTVSPADFVPLLEDTGLIVPVGCHILMEACRWAAHMQRECPRNPPLSMAVNVSAFQLQRPEFIAEVRAALAESEIPPSSLTLELTESVMMRDMELSLMRLKALRALGVKLAIDDFGTGYSSLNYVRRLPVDILKIDRSFLADPNPEVAELTAAIAQLARIFKLKAVAEGIEDSAQLQRVQAMRCDFAQGFYFAKPLPAEEILAMVAAQPELVKWPVEWARV